MNENWFFPINFAWCFSAWSYQTVIESQHQDIWHHSTIRLASQSDLSIAETSESQVLILIIFQWPVEPQKLFDHDSAGGSEYSLVRISQDQSQERMRVVNFLTKEYSLVHRQRFVASLHAWDIIQNGVCVVHGRVARWVGDFHNFITLRQK